MWTLVIVSLHMLGAPNATGKIQVLTFNDEDTCQQVRAGLKPDGSLSTCTTHDSDVSGLVAAMNCGKGEEVPMPDTGRDVLVFACSPTISIPK
jgi:hypothetical protein